MARPFNRFDIQVELGDQRMRWSSRADMTPQELARQLRELADQIDKPSASPQTKDETR